ncbi:lipid-A-disaccharide synthase [Marinimicrobium alkaliphilum]|uniref:lipid-A-disaccharide synthase n=1 Tax=Marinimicrobium alkaliphilum TaxID=2202654 RepID=UPI000DBAA844|nr:lipid-A-disaccharide synthase [Marinimicrobium alkaliphilum]
MARRLRIGIVAGEASGDILGGALIKALRHHFPEAEFSGIGGPRMLEQGFHSFFPQERLAVMGLVEPLKRLPELLRIRRFLRRHYTENPPDVFIGIDSPDFTLTLEGWLKEVGVPTVHYVSPSVWAWRQKRVHKVARSVDLMLTLFPFEADFYRDHQVPVTFVGHHLADAMPLDPDQSAARRELNLAEDARVIALLPGSRASEVERLGPLFMQAAAWCLKQNPKLQFVIPAANPLRYRQLHHQLAGYTELPIQMVHGQSRTVMAAADVVLMASGTTSLEALLLKKPMVIAYRMAGLSFAILKRLVKSPWVGLPNILAGEALVPELLQKDATAEKMGRALMTYIDDPSAARLLTERFYQLHRTLRQGASERAAEAVAELIRSRRGELETADEGVL